MRTTWTFHTAGQLLFGRNATRQLGEVAGRLGVKRVLIVTDPILVKAGLVEPCPRPAERSGHRRRGLFRRRAGAVAAGRRRLPSRLRARVPARRPRSASAAAATWTWPRSPPSSCTHGGEPRDYVGDDKIPGPDHAADLRADHGRHRLGSVRRRRC